MGRKNQRPDDRDYSQYNQNNEEKILQQASSLPGRILALPA